MDGYLNKNVTVNKFDGADIMIRHTLINISGRSREELQIYWPIYASHFNEDFLITLGCLSSISIVKILSLNPCNIRQAEKDEITIIVKFYDERFLSSMTCNMAHYYNFLQVSSSSASPSKHLYNRKKTTGNGWKFLRFRILSLGK